MSSRQPILTLRNVVKNFKAPQDIASRLVGWLGRSTGQDAIRAVDGVTLSVWRNEVVGLVGESGCGKSTLGRIAAGILQPTSGSVLYQGKDRARLRGDAAKEAQLRVQMIFQDPMSSLNPRLKIADIIAEAPLAHGLLERGKRHDFVCDQLHQVGLDESQAQRYPHEFSGGQRQRIGIARALAVRPELLVCDESIAALDVSIQAQILNLFMRLRQELKCGYLFISHDLSVVKHIADRVAIMYLGRIVEEGSVDRVFAAPAHPYTQMLLAGMPQIDAERPVYRPPAGEPPSPLSPPSGCHYHPRCPYVQPRCSRQMPQLRDVVESHRAACFLVER